MTRHPFHAIAIAVAALLTACESHTYDEGDSSYSYMMADLCEAQTSSDCSVSLVVMDDGTQKRLTTAQTADWLERPDTAYRALVYYNNVETSGTASQAEIVSMQQVPVVKPIRVAQTGNIKTDPVSVVSLWKGSNGKYLNIRISIKTGTPDEGTASQTLGMAETEVTQAADGLSCSHLTLMHDQGGVPEYYSQAVLFSLPLATINADSVSIDIQTAEGISNHRFAVKAE